MSVNRPYISVAQGEPFEISDDAKYVAKVGEESPGSHPIIQYFITCVFDGSSHEDSLRKEYVMRKAVKDLFLNNPKLRLEGGDPQCIKSRSTITPKLIRNKGDFTTAFTLILQCELVSN